MRIGVMFAICATALAGCGDLTGGGEMLARETAKGVVNGVVSTRLPGVNVAPLTDCIIESATLPEVYQIAQAAVAGPGPGTTSLILDIAQRPQTISCATGSALDTFLSGL